MRGRKHTSGARIFVYYHCVAMVTSEVVGFTKRAGRLVWLLVGKGTGSG